MGARADSFVRSLAGRILRWPEMPRIAPKTETMTDFTPVTRLCDTAQLTLGQGDY